LHSKGVKSAFLIASILATTLSACATAPEDVSPRYQSAAKYDPMTCEGIVKQREEIAEKVEKVSGKQRAHRTEDEVAIGVGAVIFWPALLWLAVGSKKTELADLKGQYEAVQRAADAKHCPA
jgi:hypothetical protein